MFSFKGMRLHRRFLKVHKVDVLHDDCSAVGILKAAFIRLQVSLLSDAASCLSVNPAPSA